MKWHSTPSLSLSLVKTEEIHFAEACARIIHFHFIVVAIKDVEA